MDNLPENMSWTFAVINGRLGEVHFDMDKKIPEPIAHYYIQRNEYSKREQKMMDKDIKNNVFVYRNEKYTRKTI